MTDRTDEAPPGNHGRAGVVAPEVRAGRPGPAPWWQAIPREVRAITVLFALVLVLWTVVVPRYRAPDEPAHLDLVLYLAEGADYPEFDERFIGQAIGYSREPHLVAPGYPWPRFAAADAPPRTERPDLWDLGGTAPDPLARTAPEQAALLGAPYVFNQQPQHPPLYYEAMAMALRVERALLPGPRPPPLDRELGLLRLLNVLLVSPLPILTWLTAKRMGAGQRAAIAASVVPLGLPQLTHVGASLNNDNLLTLLGAVLAVLLAGVARGRRTVRTDLLVGVVVGLALLTKAFGLVFVPWVAGAYVLAWFASSTRRREVVLGSVRAGVTSVIVGSWWWLDNYVRHGEPAPTSESLTRTAAQQPVGFDPQPWSYGFRFVRSIVGRTWVWIGYRSPKVELPPAIIVVLSLLVLGAVVVAVSARGPVGARPRRREMLLGLVPLGLLFLAVARRGWGLHVTTGGFPFVQGRYLYAAIVPLFALVAIGAHRVLGRRTTSVLLGVAVFLQGWTLLRVMGTAWAGSDLVGQLRSMLAWSPWPPVLVGIVTVGAGAALVATVRAVQAGVDGVGRARPTDDGHRASA